jgi:hypothetical protein
MSDFQIIEYAFSGLAAFVYGGYDEVRTANHVASGKNLRVGGLEGEGGTTGCAYPAPFIALDLRIL